MDGGGAQPNQPDPSCLPLHPGAENQQIPAAVAIGLPKDKDQVDIVSFQGTQLWNNNLDDLSWQDNEQLHFAGGFSGGLPNLPVVYHSMSQTTGHILRLNQNNNISLVAQSPEFVTIAGQKGGSNIAYTLNTSGPTGWISYLYFTDYTQASSATSTLTLDQGDGYVIWPLAVHAPNGQAQGVWYTQAMYGIGNIIFAPHRDLLYFDSAANQVTSFLGPNSILAGFSTDHTWVAYDTGAATNPAHAETSLTLKNLITCQEVTLNLLPTSNLGGGWLTFSPDNQMVAWLEASGPYPMEAELYLRVANIDGTIIVESPITNLTGLAGGEPPTWINPVGWADNHLLVLEVSITGLSNPMIVLWAPDPAQPLDPVLGANQSYPLGEGRFMGFIYP